MAMQILEYMPANVLIMGDLRLMPGVNKIRSEQFDAWKDHPRVKKMLDAGDIKLRDYRGKQPAPDVSSNVADVLSFDEAKLSLHQMTVAEAKSVIENTFDVELLKEMMENDDRQVIIKAIKKQIKRL